VVLGRRDREVQVGAAGYPGEIEGVLLEHPWVAHALVCAQGEEGLHLGGNRGGRRASAEGEEGEGEGGEVLGDGEERVEEAGGRKEKEWMREGRWGRV